MASASVKSFQVDIATNPSVILITPEPVASFAAEAIPVNNIKSVTPIYFDYTPYAAPVAAAPILAYAIAPNRITIGGDHAVGLVAGTIVTISGSTGNDGPYTVVSAVYNGTNTVITVVELIDPTVVDGTLAYTPTSGNVENNDSGDHFRETYPYPRMTVIDLELVDGTKVEIELQSITNHPTWSTGTLAGLQAASLAINALL